MGVVTVLEQRSLRHTSVVHELPSSQSLLKRQALWVGTPLGDSHTTVLLHSLLSTSHRSSVQASPSLQSVSLLQQFLGSGSFTDTTHTPCVVSHALVLQLLDVVHGVTHSAADHISSHRIMHC
eukprot:TRINITY_DN400_c0_g2_i2.p1 TRINITY_DN400_c0_g2~~TRINITY_DN400_c0_g2_i2.p1  ORF type:complete len:123 (-),score=2.94 TRINITY_DN400_c0_g2_i2:72-440(-)